MKNIKEEVRTVSGFSEFVHNGKESIMENDDNIEITFKKSQLVNFSQEKDILIQKYKGSLSDFLKTLNELNLPNCIQIQSLKHILSVHKEILKMSQKNISLIIRNIDNQKEIYKIIALGNLIITQDKKVYLTLSKINFNIDLDQTFYNNIIDILLKKNLLKIKNINLLVDEDIIKDNYIPEFFNESDNKFIYTCINPYYIEKEKENNNKNKKENHANQEQDKEVSNYKRDEIETDDSYLTQKNNTSTEPKEKNNTTSLPSAIAKGISQGWEDAKSKKGILKTIKDTYNNIKNKG